jgi:hypothetical protein
MPLLLITIEDVQIGNENIQDKEAIGLQMTLCVLH